MSSRRAVLLLNLGSPDSPSVKDVRRYLKEFLLDPRVIDGPWLTRQFVVRCLILPSRPKNSAHAYQSIWQPEGSPLVITSRKVQSLLQEKVNMPVELAMRYGKPSIPDVLSKMLNEGVKEIVLLPLYPHYAMSSYETVVERVREVLCEYKASVDLRILQPFYRDSLYIDALVDSARDELRKGYDHLLMSFHGLPQRHLKISDPTHEHCLMKDHCCSTPGPAHDFCYRAQAFQTVQHFVSKAGVPSERYSVSFQSRLGRDPWLQPFTDERIPALAREGVRKLLVMAPSFVSDCLETLEELGMRGRDLFLQAGGKEFVLIPCLNENPLWIKALQQYVGKLSSSSDTNREATKKSGILHPV
jgi:protoporphyrin/coproporphyrin ferrochelatase